MRALSFPKTKKSKAIVIAGVVTVATAGGAYAYWSSLGNATGSATTGTSSAFVVTTNAELVPVLAAPVPVPSEDQ